MNMLYQHKRYDQVLDILGMFSEKKSDSNGGKYPYTCATIAVAACHKLVSLADDLTTTYTYLL